jgi:hypothetical protein
MDYLSESRTLRILWLPGLLALVIGCSKSDSASEDLHPVRGTVLTKSGQPFAGGAIDFRSVDDPSGSATGEIGADGTFKLSSVVGDEVHPGAKPGPYRVTVVPRMGEDQSATPPIQLKSMFTVQPTENDFTIKLE